MTQPTEQMDSDFVRSCDNPTVYPQFRMLAVKLKAKGIDRWGAKAIWEVLRYEMALKSVSSGEKYALNNNHVSRLARKLMAAKSPMILLASLRRHRRASAAPRWTE